LKHFFYWLNFEFVKPLKVKADLGNDEDIDKLIDSIIENYNQLDVIVNNAGVGFERDSEPITVFDELHKVNLRSIYRICLRALPLLEKSKGVIINNSSVCGLKPVRIWTHFYFSLLFIVPKNCWHKEITCVWNWMNIKFKYALNVWLLTNCSHMCNNTVDPVYSSLGYSEYPLIVNGFLRTDR
jgi:hypothetical protein